MDSRHIEILIGLALVIILPWLDAFIKRVRSAMSTSAGSSSRSPRPIQQTQEDKKAKPKRPKKNTNKASAAAINAAMLPEEGARVTTDIKNTTTFEAPREEKPNLEPLRGEELRRAIIWGEILKPKF